MTIKKLKQILKDAPDDNATVYITTESSTYNFSGYNWDDNNELELYVKTNDKEA